MCLIHLTKIVCFPNNILGKKIKGNYKIVIFKKKSYFN